MRVLSWILNQFPGLSLAWIWLWTKHKLTLNPLTVCPLKVLITMFKVEVQRHDVVSLSSLPSSILMHASLSHWCSGQMTRVLLVVATSISQQEAPSQKPGQSKWKSCHVPCPCPRQCLVSVSVSIYESLSQSHTSLHAVSAFPAWSSSIDACWGSKRLEKSTIIQLLIHLIIKSRIK